MRNCMDSQVLCQASRSDDSHSKSHRMISSFVEKKNLVFKRQPKVHDMQLYEFSYCNPDLDSLNTVLIYMYIVGCCAHPFLSFIYFLLPSPSHGVCFPFSGLRIFSLSIPLCESLTSTPFLLLVYYLFFCWIFAVVLVWCLGIKFHK